MAGNPLANADILRRNLLAKTKINLSFFNSHCCFTVQISNTAEISQNTRLEIAIEAPRHSLILTRASIQMSESPTHQYQYGDEGFGQNQQAVPRSRTSTSATTMTRTVAIIKTRALNHRFDIRIQEASFEVSAAGFFMCRGVRREPDIFDQIVFDSETDPHTTKAAALRAGVLIEKTATAGPRSKERQTQTFTNVPGHKRNSKIAVASTAAPTIAPLFVLAWHHSPFLYDSDRGRMKRGRPRLTVFLVIRDARRLR